MATYNGTFLPDLYTGTDDDDTIYGKEGTDILWGGAGNDRIDGGSGDDALHGGDGDDVLRGGDGVATILSYYDGGDGNDTMIASSGGIAEEFNGGSGIDTVSFAERDRGVHVHLDFESLPLIDTIRNVENVVGTRFDDLIEGNVADNRLTGGDGDDTMRGGAGNDTLVGGTGSDLLDGGEGADTVDYSRHDRAVTVDLTLTDAQQVSESEFDTLTSIEGVVGSAFGDTVTGSAAAERIFLGAGDDIADASAGNDVLYGGAGNDVLHGGAGNDFIDGGSGVDTVSFADDSAGVRIDLNGRGRQLVGNSGTDIVRNVENVTGSHLADHVIGNTAANQLIGASGNDVLSGRAGDDGLSGGDGSDQLIGGTGNDVLDGGSGFDTVRYDGAASRVIVDLSRTSPQDTGDGIDTLQDVEAVFGSRYADVLTGNGTTNIIRGNAGNDRIDGGAGNDRLYGGTGADTLTGGAGHDRFGFDTALSAASVDTITDFVRGVDRITLAHEVFAGMEVGKLAAGAFALGGAAGDADDRILYDRASGALRFDVDGAGGAAAVLFANLTPGTALTAGSFLIV